MGKFNPCPHHITPAWLVERVHDATHPPVACDAIDLTTTLQDVTAKPNIAAYALNVQRKKCVTGHTNAKGISRIRVGKTCKPQFTVEDDRTNTTVPNLTLNDLSRTTLDWAIKEHQRTYQTTDALLDHHTFLHQAGLLQQDHGNDTITLAALLLFGKSTSIQHHTPHCETIITINGQTTRLRKNLLDSINDLILTERSILRTACPSIPQETLRELLVNAYNHPCWRTSAPIIITLDDQHLDITNPGDLLASITVNTLLHCLPAYRNLLLADATRIVGLADKIGKGINIILSTALRGGFDFPLFDSDNNTFRATIPLARSDEFREFVRRRSASLSQLDELVVLRALWNRDDAPVHDLDNALQRGTTLARKILTTMCDKRMIDTTDGTTYHLTTTIRLDIKTVFQADQLDLFGAA